MADTGQALVDEGSPGPLSIPKMLHFLGYGAYKVVVQDVLHPESLGARELVEDFRRGEGWNQAKTHIQDAHGNFELGYSPQPMP